MSVTDGDPTLEVAWHLNRTLGAALRREEAEDRLLARRELVEERTLADVLGEDQVTGGVVRLGLDADNHVVEGHVLGVGPDLVAIAAVPDGARLDISLARVAVVERLAPGRGLQGRAHPDIAGTLAARLQHLRVIELGVDILMAGGRRVTGRIVSIGPDNLVVAGDSTETVISTGHILVVRSRPRPAPRWAEST